MRAIYAVTMKKGYPRDFFWINYQSEVGRNVPRESQEIESKLMVWWPEGVFKSHEWF